MNFPNTISVENVTLVLLADGDWYDVRDHSFVIGAYEFVSKTVDLMFDEPTVLGFQFRGRDNNVVSGPFTAVLAVMEK